MRLTRRQTLASVPAAAAAPLLMPRGARADAHAAAGPRGANHRVLTLGDVEVVTLLDGSTPREDPQSIFGMNVDAQTFEQVSADNFISAEAAQFFFTPVLVKKGDAVILFDTGLGQGGIQRALEEAGHAPADVTHVVITHMHGDHVGGLMSEGAPTFANAEHVTGEAEMAHWSANPNEAVTNNIMPLKDRFTLVNDGAEIAPGITGMNAFGHTPGHMVWTIDGGEASMMVFADTANHYVWSLAHPDWEVRFDMDKAQAAQTRRRVLDMLAAERMALSGYHMPFPGTGFVRASGDGYEYEASSYQFM